MKKDVVQKDSRNCVDRDADDAVDLSADIPWKKVIFIKMRQIEVSFLKIPKFRMECYPL